VIVRLRLNRYVNPLRTPTIPHEDIRHCRRCEGGILATIILRVNPLIGFGVAVVRLIQEHVVA
jgi:hypothetical protein